MSVFYLEVYSRLAGKGAWASRPHQPKHSAQACFSIADAGKMPTLLSKKQSDKTHPYKS
jgi:hypothetical protein